MELRLCLFLSRFTGTVGDAGLRDLLTRAREDHRAREVTGALLFDGERFVQLLEGPAAVIVALTDALRVDARHHGFTVLGEGPLLRRRHRRWTAGYVELDHMDAFERAAAASGGLPEAALSAFDALFASADVE